MQSLGPNQTQWLAALRSGEYAQGKNHLNHNSQFCCLGVACEVFKTDTTVIAVDHDCTYYDGFEASAPEYVITSLGLHGSMGESVLNEDFISLANDNDNGMTFVEIAAQIEANPAFYFKETK